MEFFLGVHKVPSHWIVHERIAVLLEISDLFAGQCDGHLLLLLQSLTLVNQIIVFGPRCFVPHKRIDALADGLHIRLVQDGLAEFSGKPSWTSRICNPSASASMRLWGTKQRGPNTMIWLTRVKLCSRSNKCPSH